MLDMGLVVGALMIALFIQSNPALLGPSVITEGLTRGVLMALGMLEHVACKFRRDQCHAAGIVFVEAMLLGEFLRGSSQSDVAPEVLLRIL